MKTLKRFLFVTVLVIAVQSMAQQTTLYYKGCGKYSAKTFDLSYGTNGMDKPIGNHFKFALFSDGQYLYGTDALTQAQQPIWGDSGDKTINELLPTLTPDIGIKYFYTNNWHPILQDSLPTAEGMYILRKWSGDYFGGQKTYYKSNQIPLESSVYWLEMGFWEEWKLAELPDKTPVLNPDWVNNEEIRIAERAEYKRICQLCFVLMGDYSFPSLPYNNSANGGCDNWIWMIKYQGENRDTIAVDASFWLASPMGWPIVLYRPLPTTYPSYNLKWDTKVGNTINLSGEERVKKLLGL